MGKYIRQKNGKFYLVDKHKDESGKWKETWKEITDKETIEKLMVLATDKSIEEQTVSVSCFNPECNNQITLTIKQKRDLLLSFQKKYGKVVLVTCCPECQEKVLKMMSKPDVE